MALANEPRSKAMAAILLWLVCFVFFLAVVLSDYEFTFGGRTRMSEGASDILAAAGALFSAWAVLAWVRRLVNADRS